MEKISDYERAVNACDTTVKIIFDSIREVYPKTKEEYVDYNTFMIKLLELLKRAHEELE